MTNDAPPLSLLLGEMWAVRDWALARFRPQPIAADVVGNDAPVITLPGFMAGDIAMAQMRESLRAAGFRARGWQLGANLGASHDTIERIHARVNDVAQREGRSVHLVGWSLGGVFAREYAKRHPEMVASVVSMGSPFSGSRKANNAWRLYGIVAGHSVEDTPIEFHPADKPDVPTYALWSKKDGVIAAASACGLPHESDRSMELECGHMAFAYAPESVRAVIECLLEAEAARGR